MLGKNKNVKVGGAYKKVVKVFKAAGNEKRLAILVLLSKKPALSSGEVLEELKINYQTGSAHLRQLENAELISKRKDGNFIRHELTNKGKSIIKLLKNLLSYY